MLTVRAAAELRALGSRPRGMLISALAIAAVKEPGDGLRLIWAAEQVGACEVIARDRVVLVYAIRSGSSLRDVLYGQALHRRFRYLAMRRAVHG
jgi:hypothetical protein